MKTKLLICSLLLGSALLTLAAKDPVLMTINGKDVKLSEFEYLYNKNNQQQVEKESLDQYVDRFILYKQKVADAEANGLDTTASFRKEFDGYKKELAAPYMVEDTTYRWKFIQEAYERSKTEVDIDHFMLPLTTTELGNNMRMSMMDSLRNCILAGQDWGKLADEYSSDPSKERNHGHYGYIGANTFPYEFENVVYETPVGEISKPFRTQFGIHMLRVNARRPYEGVRASHIIKMFPRNATEEQKQEAKHQIDSIYALLKAGADFEELAKAESQDGTAKRGGDLGWFSRGHMVQPFEDIAFKMQDGEISEPFATQFGYHVIKKVAHGTRPLSDLRSTIETSINRDQRSGLIRKHRLADLKTKYNFKTDAGLDNYITSTMAQHGDFDSTVIAELSHSNRTLYTYGDKRSQTVAALGKALNPKAHIHDSEKAMEYVNSVIDQLAEKDLLEYNNQMLIESNPEYRNLVNEYRDGSLLYEISNRRIWQAAGKDSVGLQQYFEQNRSHYTWNEPHFKGIILNAKNDTILNAVKADIATFGADTLTDALHNKYGQDIRMERMCVKQGENPQVDYLVFKTGVKPDRKTYPECMVLEGHLLNAPEELNDVRGAVTSDYQDVLEKRWVEELKAKYPAKVNQKVLKQVK